VRGNLGSLCAVHHTQIDKDGRGKRKNDGKPYLQGCDAGGKQLDPGHYCSPAELNEASLRRKVLKKSLRAAAARSDFEDDHEDQSHWHLHRESMPRGDA
jgi:hypothetical protein